MIIESIKDARTVGEAFALMAGDCWNGATQELVTPDIVAKTINHYLDSGKRRLALLPGVPGTFTQPIAKDEEVQAAFLDLDRLRYVCKIPNFITLPLQITPAFIGNNQSGDALWWRPSAIS